jgi:hypothetical protein
MDDDILIIQLVHMITTDKRTLRGRLLEACIEKQQILIDDFTNRVSELLKSPGLGNEEAYDSEVLGQQSQRTEEVDGMHEALSLAKEEMNELLRLASQQSIDHARVEPGAVVVTDRDTVFVCVSIEQFEVDGEPFVGISTRSPRYIAMKGKRVGDKFQCAGIDYAIVDLF